MGCCPLPNYGSNKKFFLCKPSKTVYNPKVGKEPKQMKGWTEILFTAKSSTYFGSNSPLVQLFQWRHNLEIDEALTNCMYIDFSEIKKFGNIYFKLLFEMLSSSSPDKIRAHHPKIFEVVVKLLATIRSSEHSIDPVWYKIQLIIVWVFARSYIR